MDHALGNALVIEMEYFFAEVEVLNEGGTACAGLDRVLIICDRSALSGGQDLNVLVCDLMQLAAGAPL